MPKLETLVRVDKDRLKERLRVPLLILLVVSVLALFFVMDMPPFQKTILAGSWPEAAGVSLRSGISLMTVGKDPLWRSIVVYKYVVDGKEYVNDVIAFVKLEGLPGYEAHQTVIRYAPGCALTVSYNPRNPQESCLDVSRRWDIISNHLIMYILCAALIYLSCYPPYKSDENYPQT